MKFPKFKKVQTIVVSNLTWSFCIPCWPFSPSPSPPSWCLYLESSCLTSLTGTASAAETLGACAKPSLRRILSLISSRVKFFSSSRSAAQEGQLLE